MDHPAAHERHPSFRVDSLFYGSPRLLSPCRSRHVFFSGSRWLLSFIALPLQTFPPRFPNIMLREPLDCLD